MGELPLAPQFNSDSKILESLERCGRRLFNRRIELADRGEGFAQLLAHCGRGPSERLEHLLFTFSFDLLARNRLPTLTIDRFQRDHVIASEAGDRPDEQSLDPAPLADLAPDLARDLFVVRSPQ